MEKFQTQMDSLFPWFDEQMACLRQHFLENPDLGVVSIPKDPKDKGLLPTPGAEAICVFGRTSILVIAVVL
ncbi:hypothetical protein LguiB_016923 [Lonicera macranthoides]